MKKSLFWKYDSCFPSAEVSKLTSVRNRPNLSLKYWLLEAKDIFWICYGPKKWSKYPLEYHYRLHLVRRITIVETFFFHARKCIILGAVYQSEIWDFRREPAVIFSKCPFFQNSLRGFISHISKVKNKIIFWPFYLYFCLLFKWPIFIMRHSLSARVRYKTGQEPL